MRLITLAIVSSLWLPLYVDAAQTGHWKFQDDDASNNIDATLGNDGTFNNGGNTSAVSEDDGPGGEFVKSLRINQSDLNDQISIPHTINGTATGPVSAPRSCTIWVKVNNAASGAGIRRLFYTNSELLGLILDHTNATYRNVAYHGPNSYPVASFNGIPAGEWVHLAQTYDGTNIRAYKMGDLESTSVNTTTIGANSTTIYVGNNNTATQGAAANYCDLRVFDHALSEAEIEAIIAETDPPTPKINPSLFNQLIQ